MIAQEAPTWRYSDMDQGEHLPRRVREAPDSPEKRFAYQVAEILGNVAGGLYNAPISVEKVDWLNGRWIEVIWSYQELATWDFDGLTKLVFLAHAARIRVSVQAATVRRLRFLFYPRGAQGPDESFARGHPSLARAVEMFEAAIPEDHPVRWRPDAPLPPRL